MLTTAPHTAARFWYAIPALDAAADAAKNGYHVAGRTKQFDVSVYVDYIIRFVENRESQNFSVDSQL